MALRTVGVKLVAEVSGYTSGLSRAGKATADFKSQLDGAAKKGNLDAVADKAFVVGAALTGMAGYAIKSAADFDKAMSQVKAASYDSSKSVQQNTKDMSALRAAALQAGKDTAFSATEAADGITELSKAGVSTADILSGGLKGSLDLAAAGQLSVGEAAETAASALTQFKLQGSQVPHVADLLAAAAGKAQGSVHDVGQALNQSGLVASQFGLSIEDTTGALAEFASAGLTGSDAGTSFKTMLLAMANPSTVTKKLMDSLGVSFYDAQGKFIGLNGVAQVLKDQLGGLTEQERNAALGQIFGNDAIRAATVLYKDGTSGVTKWKDAVNDSGYASKQAQIQTDNLAGDIERLKGSLETLAIQSGSGGSSGLRYLAKGLNEIVDQFNGMPKAAGATVTIIAAVTGGAVLSLAAFIKLRKGLAEAVEQLQGMGPAGEKAASGLQKTAGAAGKAVIAMAALEAATLFLNSLNNKTTDVDKLTDSLSNLATTGNSAGELNDAFGKNFDDLGLIAKYAASAKDGYGHFINSVSDSIPIIGSAGKAFGNFTTRAVSGTDFDTATQQMQSLDTALTNYMNTSGDAAKSQDLWNQVVSKSGLDVSELSKLLPTSYQKIGELNAQAEKAKDSQGKMAAAVKGAGGAFTGQAKAAQIATDANGNYKSASDAAAAAADHQGDALKQLAKFMHEQSDPVFALRQAQVDLKKAQDDETAAIHKYGAKSKEAKDATNKLAGAAIDLQGAVGSLGVGFDGKLSPALLQTFKAAGLTDKQIKILSGEFKDAKKAADQYDGKYNAVAAAPGATDAQKQLQNAYKAATNFDGTYDAWLKTPGAKEAQAQIDKAWTAVKGYDGNWVAHISTKGYDQTANDLRHLLAAQQALKDNTSVNEANRELGHFFAGGGPVYGAGTATSDSIRAWLSNGEHVWTAAEVDALGGQQAMLVLRSAVRSGKRVEVADEPHGYATGGAVTLPFPTDVKKTKIPADIYGGFTGGFGNWPSSPSAQRGDSGVWRKVVALIKSTGPISGSFGNAYRPGDPLWHGSGRAVDWMGYNQDALATFLANQRPLELIHRSKNRDYAYTRGKNKGSFHESLMEAHRNHVHIAMANGGTINEPIMGIGASGKTYSFGENYQKETVIPNWQAGNGSGGGGMNVTINLTAQLAAGANMREAGRQIAEQLGSHLGAGGTIPVRTRQVTL